MSNWAHVWVGWYFCASVIMSIFLRPKIRLEWGCWRSLEVNCANFVAKVKFGNSFRYNILSSLKSEVALRSLKAAWGDVWEFFSRLIVQIFCMACSLHAISLMSIILRPRSVQMLRSLEVTSDHLLLTSNFCSLRIVEGGLWRPSFFWGSNLPQHQNIFMKTFASKEPSTEIQAKSIKFIYFL